MVSHNRMVASQSHSQDAFLLEVLDSQVISHSQRLLVFLDFWSARPSFLSLKAQKWLVLPFQSLRQAIFLLGFGPSNQTCGFPFHNQNSSHFGLEISGAYPQALRRQANQRKYSGPFSKLSQHSDPQKDPKKVLYLSRSNEGNAKWQFIVCPCGKRRKTLLLQLKKVYQQASGSWADWAMFLWKTKPRKGERLASGINEKNSKLASNSWVILTDCYNGDTQAGFKWVFALKLSIWP